MGRKNQLFRFNLLFVCATVCVTGCSKDGEFTDDGLPTRPHSNEEKIIKPKEGIQQEQKETERDTPNDPLIDIRTVLVDAQLKGVLNSFVVRVKSYEKRSGRSGMPGSGIIWREPLCTELELIEPTDKAGQVFQVFHMRPPPEGDSFRNIGGVYRVRFKQSFVEHYFQNKPSRIGAAVLEIL